MAKHTSTAAQEHKMKLIPYDYQRAAIDAIYAAWTNGTADNPLVVVPTGGGKSLIIAQMIFEMLATYPNTRIANIIHSKRLVQQNAKQMQNIWPEAPISFYSGGKKDRSGKVIFGTIQSMAQPSKMYPGMFSTRAQDIGFLDIIIIDESHLLSRKSQSQYQRFIKEAREINPLLKIVGLTATPMRMDSGGLTRPFKGELPMFDKIVYNIEVTTLIERGAIVPPVTKATKTRLDASGVDKRGGEFVLSSMIEAVDQPDINRACVDEIIESGASRQKWLIFCSGIKHAYHVCEIMLERGIPCAVVHGAMSDKEQDKILHDYHEGRLRALLNADLLTTGFDEKGIDLLAFLRLTNSPVLWVQMVGRGLRALDGKPNCLILDFAENTARLGPIDQVFTCTKQEDADDELAEPKKAPVKECPDCHTLVHASLRECKECGHIFPSDPFGKLNARPSDAPLLSSGVRPEWHDVTGVTYDIWTGNDGRQALVCDYECGLATRVREFINVDAASGYARRWAEGWWRERMFDRELPGDVRTAMLYVDDLRVPGRIMTQRIKGKYQSVTAYDFSISQAEVKLDGKPLYEIGKRRKKRDQSTA
jgi:DNA repair protein RadD